MIKVFINQGRKQGGAKGLKPSLIQVRVKTNDEISDSFDLFCVLLI